MSSNQPGVELKKVLSLRKKGRGSPLETAFFLDPSVLKTTG